MQNFTACFHKRSTFFILVITLLACTDPNHTQRTSGKEVTDEQPELHLRINKPFRGDLAQMRERRSIRVLVSYSKTNFFFEGGTPRGFECELLHEYEKFLNMLQGNKYQQTKMVFLPIPFDQLLSALQDGYGDIAAAGLTITPEREKSVKFTNPYIPEVHEVVVINSAVKDIDTIGDLSGRMVYLRSGSSYITHVEAMSVRFVQNGMSPIRVVEADRCLATEDILELVNAGVVELTVADQHISEAWSQVLPDIVVRQDITVNSSGSNAWAVRKDNPELLASLNAFVRKSRKGSLLGNILFKRYYQSSKWIKNPTTEREREKLQSLVSLFKKYADIYGFDWLAIAAQAYQESSLDHNKRSRRGAIGIMQIIPSTASDKSVNIRDIHILENNIHAGVKYLHFLRDRYFSSSDIKPADRVNFTWAAYNAGPAKINRLRRIAKSRGFNPNMWFLNVEKIAAEIIGRETVEYVANINKYYIAYKLYEETNRQRERSLKSLRPIQEG